MRGQLRRTGLGVLLTATLVAVAWAEGKEGGGLATMHEGTKIEACKVCHSSQKDLPKLADLTRSCDNNCIRCHKDIEKHHPVGSEVREKDKVPLPLLSDYKVSCISCHDAASPASDSMSWKAQSFFARLFQKQTTYKTYFLRINNQSGQLCKTCH